MLRGNISIAWMRKSMLCDIETQMQVKKNVSVTNRFMCVTGGMGGGGVC